MKELLKELFSPEDQDNKASTPVLEEISAAMAQTWIAELVDPTKTTWDLLSESDGKYSWEGLAEELKSALLGLVAVNDLAESSFGGVTAQLEVFGRVGLAHAAAVSDMQQNELLDRPTTIQDMKNNTISTVVVLPSREPLFLTMYSFNGILN